MSCDLVHSKKPRPVELLSPAGDWQCLRAAAANGADAIYFGLSRFSARARAANFAPTELPEVLAFLHDRNVKGYLAINTLLLPEELSEAAGLVELAASAGADAIIVQDLGLAALIHRMVPALAIHASTQMTLAEPGAAELAAGLGVSRIILPRELSLAEIRQMAAVAEVEVFCHGALCISFSGQCRASESLWQRSGNRGQCGQACRLTYEVLRDRPAASAGAGRRAQAASPAGAGYALSPRDLSTYDRTADLIAAGVSALKIEGRMKTPAYVAAATRMYRLAIDAAMAGRAFQPPAELALALEQSFSRGFTSGFLDGPRPAGLVDGAGPGSRGVLVGRVVGRSRRGVLVRLDAGRTCAAGDGLLLSPPHERQKAIGGRLFAVAPAGRGVELRFGNSLDLSAVQPGWSVRRTDEPRMERELEKTFARVEVVHREKLAVSVRASPGRPLELTASDSRGNQATIASAVPLAGASSSPLTLELLRGQLQRLGGTPFELGEVELLDGDSPVEAAAVVAPASELNSLRRRAIERLMELRRARAVHEIKDRQALRELLAQGRCRPQPAGSTPRAGRLHVLVRTIGQIEALAALPGRERSTLGSIFCDLPDLGQYGAAKRLLRSAGLPFGAASPRVIKPMEQPLLEALGELGPEAVLARSLGAVAFFHGRAEEIVADSSLNCANPLSAAVLLNRGADRLSWACELHRSGAETLLKHVGPAALECVAHEHAPMFYTQYDLAGCQSTGPRPAEPATALVGRNGEVHPVAWDLAGRPTVLRGKAVCRQQEELADLAALGVRNFRLEFGFEPASEVAALVLRISSAVGLNKSAPAIAAEP